LETTKQYIPINLIGYSFLQPSGTGRDSMQYLSKGLGECHPADQTIDDPSETAGGK
jgi:hypothetical protein